MMLAVLLIAVPGCRKKPDKAALEAVETGGKKPPLVQRKAKGPDAGAAAGADNAGTRAAKAATGAAAPSPFAVPTPLPAAAVPAPAAPPAAAAVPSEAAPGSPVVPVLALPPPAQPGAGRGDAKAEPAPAEEAKQPGEAVATAERGADRPGGVVRGDRKGPEPAPAPEAPALPPPPPPAPEAPVVGEPSLDVSGYISAMDLELVLGTKQKFRRADLPGVPATPGYNALYYEPEKGDYFGVSVQVWRDSNLAESRTRFNTMRNTYSNVAPTNKVTEQGFRSFHSGVVTVVFADPRRPIVAAVACSTKLCNADQLLHLARNVSERLR